VGGKVIDLGMTIQRIFGIACLSLMGAAGFGQKTEYTVVNRNLSTDGGVVRMNEAHGPGIAWIKGLPFTAGTIEFDVKGRDVQQQSFVGFAFHGVNDSTYEAIYFRPFNFRSTDPVRKGHCVQYVAEPKYDWKTLREKFPNKYEQPVSPVPDPGDWFHAKIVVGDNRIEVFVNGNTAASLIVEPIVHRDALMAGFWAGESSDGSWRNLRINGKPIRE
jgi:hypothetical protein